VQVVASILGHANAAFTLHADAWVSPKAHRDAADAIEDDVDGEAACVAHSTRISHGVGHAVNAR